MRAFVDDLAPEVEALGSTVATLDPARLRADVEVEAYNLTCAFIDADGLHTDDELWALVAAFGHRLPSDLGRATPAHIRDAGLVVGRRALLGARRRRCSRCWRPPTPATAAPGRSGSSAAARTSATRSPRWTCCRPAPSWPPSRRSGGPCRRPSPRRRDAAGRARHATPAGDGAGAAAASPPEAAPPAPEELPPARPLDDLLAELDALVGLEGVKHEVHLVTNLLRVQQIRRERGLPVLDQSRHLIFTGNPGTGKTTVARLLAQIYRTLGVVERGHLVETDRAGLVAGFVGQTAGRVVAAFDRAEGGVLLIDEAYSLARGGENDFGREAIDTVVKLVEDRRDRLVVILAGYPDEMEALVGANPGMRSRFPKTIHFPDYSDDELVRIVAAIGAAGRYTLDAGAEAALRR